MRNIANGAIDGLPTELRTVFVQHDIVASDVSWLLGSKGLKGFGCVCGCTLLVSTPPREYGACLPQVVVGAGSCRKLDGEACCGVGVGMSDPDFKGGGLRCFYVVVVYCGGEGDERLPF